MYFKKTINKKPMLCLKKPIEGSNPPQETLSLSGGSVIPIRLKKPPYGQKNHYSYF